MVIFDNLSGYLFDLLIVDVIFWLYPFLLLNQLILYTRFLYEMSFIFLLSDLVSSNTSIKAS